MPAIGRSEKTFVLMVSNGLVYFLAMLVPIFLVRFLSKVDYGTYSQAYMIGGMFYSSFLLGVVPSIYHFYPLLQGERQRTLLRQSVVMLTLQGLIACLCLVLLSNRLGEAFHNPELPGMLRIYAMYLFFITASDYFQPLLIAQGSYRFSMIAVSLESSLKLVFLLTPLFLGFGIKVLMGSAALFAFIRLAIYSYINYFHNLKSWKWKEWSQKLFWDQIHFSVPLGLVGIIGIIGQNIDKVIVSSFLTPADYAIYAIGVIEIPLASVLQNSVMMVLRTELPKLVAENRFQEIREIWGESVRKMAIILLPIFIYLFINAEQVVVFLFTEKYRQSVSVFSLSLFLLPGQVANFSVVPVVFKKTFFVFVLSVIGICFYSVIGLIFISAFGVNGIVIARVLTLYLIISVHLVYSERLLHVPLFTLFPWKTVAAITTLALVAGVVSHYALNYWMDERLLFLIGSGLVFAGLYSYFVFKFKLLTQWDKDLIMKWSTAALRWVRRPVKFQDKPVSNSKS